MLVRCCHGVLWIDRTARHGECHRLWHLRSEEIGGEAGESPRLRKPAAGEAEPRGPPAAGCQPQRCRHSRRREQRPPTLPEEVGESDQRLGDQREPHPEVGENLLKLWHDKQGQKRRHGNRQECHEKRINQRQPPPTLGLLRHDHIDGPGEERGFRDPVAGRRAGGRGGEERDPGVGIVLEGPACPGGIPRDERLAEFVPGSTAPRRELGAKGPQRRNDPPADFERTTDPRAERGCGGRGGGGLGRSHGWVVCAELQRLTEASEIALKKSIAGRKRTRA